MGNAFYFVSCLYIRTLISVFSSGNNLPLLFLFFFSLFNVVILLSFYVVYDIILSIKYILKGRIIMLMDLPRYYKSRNAEIINGQLFLFNLVRYDSVIVELVYHLEKKRCIYCKRNLRKSNIRTVDHQYPIMHGGVHITNNLSLCCRSCNHKKGALTHDQFLQAVSIVEKESRQEYMQTTFKEIAEIKKSYGFLLPKDWISHMNTKDIHMIHLTPHPKGAKYEKIAIYYEKFGFLPPVILDCNHLLLDGYNTIAFAVDNKIPSIPSVILENAQYISLGS